MRVLLAVLCLAVPSLGESKYIPHIAQGQGWETHLQVINTCDEPVSQFRIDFFNSQGEPIEFKIGQDRVRYDSVIYNSSYPPLNKGGISLNFYDLGRELIYGYGKIVDETGCVSADILYLQTSTPGLPFATIPAQKRSEKSVLLFYSEDVCQTHMAISGVEDNVTVDAYDGQGNSLGSYLIAQQHSALSIATAIPQTHNIGAGSLHIRGKSIVMALDFCEGVLIQFRLAHPAPE